MTIFDTLRFSNPDIANNNDLKNIPREILETWIAECIEDVNYPFELNLKDKRNDFSVIIYNIMLTKIKETSYTARWDTIDILIGLHKKRFTNSLKKIIAAYDPQ